MAMWSTGQTCGHLFELLKGCSSFLLEVCVCGESMGGKEPRIKCLGAIFRVADPPLVSFHSLWRVGGWWASQMWQSFCGGSLTARILCPLVSILGHQSY